MPQRTVGLRRRPALTRRSLLLLTTAAVAAVPVYASVAYAATGVEVETMTLPTKSGYAVAESAASGGKAFKFLRSGVANKHVTTSAAASRVVLRARGSHCAGAPVATVTIDGTQRLRSAVASTTYSEYAADVALSRGTHTITVAFANDYRSISCDRNLYADKITLLDQATSPQPAPSATAGPAATDDGVRLFDSGFEAGVSPWGGVQACPSEGKSEVSVVSTLALHGAYSMRSSVSGTCSFGSQRAEVLNAGSQYRYTEGQELYFADSVYFPANFPATQKGHCITMQIHTLQRGEQATSPAFSVWCRDAAGHTNTVMLRTGAPGCQWQTPMVRSVWHNFVVRMKFSTSSSVGSWDLWYGTGTHPTYVEVARNCASNALLSATDYGYYKVGLYRGLENADTATVYHDDTRVGTSFAAVAQ
jgi:hypothetical protein